jgi:hypothetical protein
MSMQSTKEKEKEAERAAAGKRAKCNIKARDAIATTVIYPDCQKAKEMRVLSRKL